MIRYVILTRGLLDGRKTAHLAILSPLADLRSPDPNLDAGGRR